MLEWASGGSERPFNQSAANGRKEPKPEMSHLRSIARAARSMLRLPKFRCRSAA